MSTQIQLYTGDTDGYFSSEQLSELDKDLDERLVSERRGGFGRKLKYIEGHDAIDNANRIFGYGNWGYRPLSVEQVVLLDPLSGEAVGIEYKALVELTVRGAIVPVVDIGSQPVATWNVEDQIMQRRLKAANGGNVDESEFTLIEKREARAVITEAHEQAKKGAVTDALKRCLRVYGSQFGNGLYGDGHVDLDVPVQGKRAVVESRPQQQAQLPRQLNAAKPAHVVDADTSIAQEQSRGLKVLLGNARTRAFKLGIKGQDFVAFCIEATGKEPDALTLDDMPKLNGVITQRESTQQPAEKAS